jgi:hypothetical protein
MPKSKAEGHEKWILLSTPPSDPDSVTVTEATAGIDASCAIAASDSRISASASETFSDPAVCDTIAIQDFGASNFEGTIAPFRYFDEAGKSEVGSEGAVRDEVYQALKEKGTSVHVLIRDTSKESTDDLEAGDEYELYEVTTDEPQRPSDRSGYQKRIVPLSIKNAWKGVLGPVA